MRSGGAGTGGTPGGVHLRFGGGGGAGVLRGRCGCADIGQQSESCVPCAPTRTLDAAKALPPLLTSKCDAADARARGGVRRRLPRSTDERVQDTSARDIATLEPSKASHEKPWPR